MTTYDDRLTTDVEVDLTDRRAPTSAVRVSWASARPFVVPEPPTPSRTAGRAFDPVARAERRRTRWARPLLHRALVGDAAIAALVWGAVVASLRQPSSALLGAVGAAALWCTVLWLLRGYDSRRIGSGPEEFGMVGRAAVAVLLSTSVVSYSLQLLLPRRYVLVAVPLAAALTALHRYALRRWLHRRRTYGDALLRTLVVGSPSAVDGVVGDLLTVQHHGYDIVGACVPSVLADVPMDAGVRVVGTLSDVPQSVIDHEVDVVIVAGSGLSNASLRRLSWALERTGADLVVAPGLVEVAGPRLRVRPAAGLSLLHVETPGSHQGRMIGKAVLDRTLGGLFFLASLLVVAPAALLVALTSRGGPFFRQQRIGRDGTPFTMYKLRSMVPDAEARRTDELLEGSDRDGLMFKMRRDPRVTPIGALLRRFSIDELPQLWNVVRGDMSLVGPRPPLPSEVAAYHDAVHRRLRVKPGLTGLWQVSGRADLSWEESVRLDLRYVDNWSVAFDVQILGRTAQAVVKGSGAY